LARRDRPVVALLRRHWRKFGAFGTIGFTVFLAGLALQVALVRLAGMGTVTSYVIKTLASVQLRLLLNRYLTWRDQPPDELLVQMSGLAERIAAARLQAWAKSLSVGGLDE